MANVLLEDELVPCTSVLDSTIWVPNSSPSFHGSASMVNFEDIQRENNNTDIIRPSFFNQIDTKMENCNEEFDNCFHHQGKKRRLMPDQVQFLEKSFEVENKLEPERKIQLAKELGLQPRQVAIWFQNRRARYKTKILEREYESLKASYDKLKEDYDCLCKENESMKNEVNLLTEKLLKRGNATKANPKLCDPITNQSNLQPKKPNFSPNVAQMLQCKQELDASSSAKSDVFDSDSPHYNHQHSSLAPLEPSANSSHVFEGSDFSQDEDDDSLNGRLLMPPPIFPKIEDEYYDDDLQPNSCNLGFPAQDQGTWFWQY